MNKPAAIYARVFFGSPEGESHDCQPDSGSTRPRGERRIQRAAGMGGLHYTHRGLSVNNRTSDGLDFRLRCALRLNSLDR
jgi:hypothetical protein